MSLTPIIISGIVCVLIGFAIGSLVASLSRDVKGKPTEAPEESDWNNRVTIVSDREGNGSFPKFDDRVYQSPEELSVEQRQILMDALKAMHRWLGEPEPAPAATTVKEPAPEATAAVVATTVVEVEPEAPPILSSSAKPSMNPIDLFAKAIQGEPKSISSAPKSIVAQIDEILQEKLEGTPLEKRGIRLVELPGRGMVVMVGLDQYGGVDEVPDAEVQQLIRSCAKEWENRIEIGGKPK